jgi:hypothetical protein
MRSGVGTTFRKKIMHQQKNRAGWRIKETSSRSGRLHAARFGVPDECRNRGAALRIRFWFGRTNTAKNLYDVSRSYLVSRLTYGDLAIFAAEAYTRFDFDRRWFVKGYIGGGTLRKGSLKDEDFPPVIAPYSATLSVQENGTPIYGSGDIGVNVVFGPDWRIGLFGGLHYMNQNVSAFGCTQISFNPTICGPFR